MKTTPARLAVAAGACLAAALPSFAQCTGCPPGSIQENEPQCTGTDVTNGGCNSLPPVFGSIAMGQTVCGTSGSDAQFRDTDWFQFTLAAPATVSISGVAEFPSHVAFIQGTCGNLTVYGTFNDTCAPISFSAALPAGTTWLFIATQMAPSLPCRPYAITLSSGPGACCMPSGACSLLTSAACTSAGGVHRGQGTACGNCPQPAGTWSEQPEAGRSIAAAQITMGNGPLTTIAGAIANDTDVDVYAVQICGPASFSAQTVTGPGSLTDTQLFLFKRDGVGIAFNDDSPAGGTLRSRLTSAFTSAIPAGVYYLAVAAYDNDPLDFLGNELWLDQPYNTERAPDGPNPALAVSTWAGTGGTGTYTVTLTGSCFAAPAGWTEEADAGDQVLTAQTVAGTGPLSAIAGSVDSSTDADLYRINICTPTSFDAETVTGPGSLTDTQLFLFHPNGIGIAFNDDVPIGPLGRSRLTNSFTAALPAGPYLLALTGFDRDPANAAGQPIWLDTPYPTERAPDGPGAPGPLALWQDPSSVVGSYVVRLTGACRVSPGVCYPNCDGSTGTPVLTANDFQCFIDAFAGGQSYANCDGSTGTPALTANDFQCFINKYAAGCS